MAESIKCECSIKISKQNRKMLLQLKLDWNMKSVDAVISKLLEGVKS